jgi:hypothetical protein
MINFFCNIICWRYLGICLQAKEQSFPASYLGGFGVADIWSGRASTTRLNHVLVDSVDRLFAPIRPHRRVRPLRRRLGWPQLDCLPEASESETRSMLRSTPDEGERSYRHAIASRCLARLWDPKDALTLPRGAAAATPWLPWCRQIQPSHHSDSALSTLATREIMCLFASEEIRCFIMRKNYRSFAYPNRATTRHIIRFHRL